MPCKFGVTHIALRGGVGDCMITTWLLVLKTHAATYSNYTVLYTDSSYVDESIFTMSQTTIVLYLE